MTDQYEPIKQQLHDEMFVLLEKLPKKPNETTHHSSDYSSFHYESIDYESITINHILIL